LRKIAFCAAFSRELETREAQAPQKPRTASGAEASKAGTSLALGGVCAQFVTVRAGALAVTTRIEIDVDGDCPETNACTAHAVSLAGEVAAAAIKALLAADVLVQRAACNAGLCCVRLRQC